MRLSGDQVRNAFDEYIDAMEDDVSFEEEPEWQEFFAENPGFDSSGRDAYD